MKQFFLTTVCLAMISAMAWGQARPTIEERMIRLEEGQKNLEKRIDDLRTEMNGRFSDLNGRFSDLNGRLDELRAIVLTGFGVLFAGMFVLVGFVIWDHRTALAPVARQTKELAEIDEKMLAALREFAKTNKVMQEALKKVGML